MRGRIPAMPTLGRTRSVQRLKCDWPNPLNKISVGVQCCRRTAWISLNWRTVSWLCTHVCAPASITPVSAAPAVPDMPGTRIVPDKPDRSCAMNPAASSVDSDWHSPAVYRDSPHDWISASPAASTPHQRWPQAFSIPGPFRSELIYLCVSSLCAFLCGTV